MTDKPTLDDYEMEFLASILTEHAQVQRSVRNHDKAEEIEEFRSLLYQRYGNLL